MFETEAYENYYEELNNEITFSDISGFIKRNIKSIFGSVFLSFIILIFLSFKNSKTYYGLFSIRLDRNHFDFLTLLENQKRLKLSRNIFQNIDSRESLKVIYEKIDSKEKPTLVSWMNRLSFELDDTDIMTVKFKDKKEDFVLNSLKTIESEVINRKQNLYDELLQAQISFLDSEINRIENSINLNDIRDNSNRQINALLGQQMFLYLENRKSQKKMTLKMHSDNEITKRQEIVKSPYIYNTKFKYTKLMLLFLFLVIPISNIIILIINEKSKGLIFKRLAIENLLKVKILSELKLKDNKNISFNKIYLRELLTKTDNSKILIIGNPIEEKTVNFIEEYKEIIENRFFFIDDYSNYISTSEKIFCVTFIGISKDYIRKVNLIESLIKNKIIGLILVK